MAGNQEHAANPGRGRLTLWPLAVVALIMGFALFGDRGILHMLKLSGEKNVLAGKIAEAEAQNAGLRGEIGALLNDRGYIERVARTELGMVRDDELVFQFSRHK